MHQFQKKAKYKFNFKILTNTSMFLIFFTFFAFSLWYFQFQGSLQGLNLFANNIKKITEFKNSFLTKQNLFIASIYDYLILISYGIAGSSVAFLFALFSAPICTYHASHKWRYLPLKIIINVLHFIPIIFIAYLFIFRLNYYLGAIVTIFFISWSFMHRDLVQLLETSNYATFDTNRSQNWHWWKTIFYKILPFNKNELWSIYLTRFEKSLRASTFINFFGAIHITTLLAPHFADQSFEFIGFPLITLFVGNFILQHLIFAWLKYLKKQSEPYYTFDNVESKLLKFKILQIVLATLLAILTISSIAYGLKVTTRSEWNVFYNVNKDLWRPNFKILNLHFFFKTTSQLLLQVLAVFGFVLLFGIFFGFIISTRLLGKNWKIMSHIAKIVLIFFSLIPGNLLFNLITGVFRSGLKPTAILAASLVSISSFAFALRNSIKKVSNDDWLIYQFNQKRYGTCRAFKDFFIPKIIIKVRFILANEIEEILQKITILGLFQVNIIGKLVADVTSGIQSDKILIPIIIPYVFLALIFKIFNVSLINYDNLNYQGFWNRYGFKNFHYFFIDHYLNRRDRWRHFRNLKLKKLN